MRGPVQINNAFVALGSNLASPIDQVTRAFDELAKLPHTELLKRSALYRSAPISEIVQPDFINAAAKLATSLSPEDLLDALLDIERRHGRIRGSEKNAPRTIDLDLLAYDDVVSNKRNLILPHPRMHERAFVLYPLYDIEPEFLIPGHGKIMDVLAQHSHQQIDRLVE